MASFHRVLSIFGRSVDDNSLECNHDIHPWDILIDGQRWAGKIRLVGFVDAFFLICYSGESRFEHGLMIYKDDDAIRRTLRDAKVNAEDIGLEVVNTQEVKVNEETPLKYFMFNSEKGGLHYNITSLGHPIDLQTQLPRSSLKKHTIKLRKGRDSAMKKHIRRAVMQHDVFDLMHDAVRLSIISHAEMIGMITRQTLGGSTIDDTTGKYFNALIGKKGSNDVTLSSAQQ